MVNHRHLGKTFIPGKNDTKGADMVQLADMAEEELCLICEKPFDEWDITIPRRPKDGGGKSHLECVENLIPNRYPRKIK